MRIAERALFQHRQVEELKKERNKTERSQLYYKKKAKKTTKKMQRMKIHEKWKRRLAMKAKEERRKNRYSEAVQ